MHDYVIPGPRFLQPVFFPSDEQSVINSVSCPPQATNLSSCSFSTTSSGECSSHEYDANIQCSNSELLRKLVKHKNCWLYIVNVLGGFAECFINGQVRIAHSTSESLTEYEEITGILEICVDGSYVRVCGNDDSSLNASMLVETACNDIEYGGVVYMCVLYFILLFYWLSLPLFLAGSSYSLYNATSPSINYVSCPSFLLSLTQCNFSTTDEGSCVDQNVKSNILVTCRRGNIV